jgi:hypothetical protein
MIPSLAEAFKPPRSKPDLQSIPISELFRKGLPFGPHSAPPFHYPLHVPGAKGSIKKLLHPLYKAKNEKREAGFAQSPVEAGEVYSSSPMRMS